MTLGVHDLDAMAQQTCPVETQTANGTTIKPASRTETYAALAVTARDVAERYGEPAEATYHTTGDVTLWFADEMPEMSVWKHGDEVKTINRWIARDGVRVRVAPGDDYGGD